MTDSLPQTALTVAKSDDGNMDDELEAMRRVMSTTIARWQNLVDTVPETLLNRPSTDGEWSAADCLRHMLYVERRFFDWRLNNLLDEVPELVPYDRYGTHEPEPERTPREAIAALAADRRKHEDMLAKLEPADLERGSHHPTFGRVTLRYLLSLWAAHDLQHTMQAEEAIMRAFIPNTGPWRKEFTAHDVEAATTT
jgi:uncharacterized damage-inducible protein DinB